MSPERFSTLVKAIIGSCLALSVSLAPSRSDTAGRATSSLLIPEHNSDYSAEHSLNAVLISYRNRFQCLQLAISDITGNSRAPRWGDLRH